MRSYFPVASDFCIYQTASKFIKNLELAPNYWPAVCTKVQLSREYDREKNGVPL